MINDISAQELKKQLDEATDIILLDVREPHEYEFCNLGGYLIPLGQLESRLAELDKNKTIIVHCRSGGRSQMALNILEGAGFTHLQHFTGGILGWAREVDPEFPVY